MAIIDSKTSLSSGDEYINLMEINSAVDDNIKSRFRKALGVKSEYEIVGASQSALSNEESPTLNTNYEADDEGVDDQLTSINMSEQDLDLANFNVEGGKSSMVNAVLNFINSIVGAGIIGLPFALLEAGFWTGLFMICGLALLVNWTVLLLVKTSKLAGKSSYQDLVEHCFGKAGLISISLFQFLFAFGGMCAYTVIIGDTLTTVIRKVAGNSTIFTSRRFIIITTTLLISFPLSLYRDISKLAKTSALAFVCLIYILISVMIQGPKQDPSQREFPNLDLIHPSFLQATGVISFAFVCHHNSFLIYGSLQTPTLDRWQVVTNWSTGLSCLLSLLLAVPGYLIFGSKTQANILNNFSIDDTVMNIARFSFALNMFTTFPLECFVCREVIENYYFRNQRISYRLHFIITTALTLVACTIALTTCDLGLVLELTGCFSATALAYILPAACYLNLSSGPVWSAKKIGPAVCIIFGVFVMILSTTFAIVESFNINSVKNCRW